MTAGVSIWDKLTRFVVFLLFLAGLMAVAIWYHPLIQTNERMRKTIFALDTRIQKEEESAKRLRLQIDALAHDPKAVERLVRERLGYARPGETVIRFETPAHSPTANSVR